MRLRALSREAAELGCRPTLIARQVTADRTAFQTGDKVQISEVGRFRATKMSREGEDESTRRVRKRGGCLCPSS